MPRIGKRCFDVACIGYDISSIPNAKRARGDNRLFGLLHSNGPRRWLVRACADVMQQM